MAFDEYNAERINQYLAEVRISYRTIRMMGGLCYMVDDKMCLGLIQDVLMARVGPEVYEECLGKDHVVERTSSIRSMKGYVFVLAEAFDMDEDLAYWIDLCLAYNPMAPTSKKKKKA